MQKRLVQILGFLISSLGWLFVLCTMAMDYWRITQLGGQGGSFIIRVAWYWSNLWKDCFTDSTAISNCREFPVLWTVTQPEEALSSQQCLTRVNWINACSYIHVCRGLMITAICLGFFGFAFALFGMKCTKIGGSEITNGRITFVAGVDLILSGLCSLTAFSIYANQITSEFFDPNFFGQKYELGAALYIGFGGSVLCIIGGSMLCFSISNSCTKSQENSIYKDAA